MKPIHRESVPSGELTLFEKIKYAVENIPDIDLGNDIRGNKRHVSCHMVARAVAVIFEIDFKDGVVYPNFLHSWCVTSSGNIIDVYPVAHIGGPIFVLGQKEGPSKWHYTPKQIYIQEMNLEYFKTAVKKIKIELLKFTSSP